ncbi:hypothetical protein Cgig2_009771 [Carnegiea gigantea]|uniref:FAR1 domain-containing protein n=1 Tax=Carnegiea gigantea TaxID=171969 RepID=A0A9Q1JKL2_9CARY|nr:hypothetical protein Cgig2_009771 [Carnegiea gigantea]
MGRERRCCCLCIIRSKSKSSTTKNKSGKIWKVFVCSKQGYREPRKTPPQSVIALANAISRARENVEERRVKRRRVGTREGCNACMVVSSTNDGQFESLKEIPACFKVDRWTKLAAKKPIFELDTIVSTSYVQVGQQNRMISDAWLWLYKCMDLAGRYIDKLQYVINAAESIQQKPEEVVGGTMRFAQPLAPYQAWLLTCQPYFIAPISAELGLHKMDMRNKDEVIMQMEPAVASNLTADACIKVCPKNLTNLNVDNVLVVKLAGRGLHNSYVVRGMGATKGSSLANTTCQDVCQSTMIWAYQVLKLLQIIKFTPVDQY